ncbi:ComF family protein [Carboxylicivirga sp. N1Y90]|uniref:ComF family protein n=1 Tax=Carboxylicivirga fragile TaxID=3417571 RepID=UPI003D33F8E9|nr:ComF family protein [Marinilabiliaceae bacterium N1Y90]
MKPDDNAISAMMWGRCQIKHAYSLYFYRKGERVQQLLHGIKYRGNKVLGTELGKQVGHTIKNNAPIAYDLIIPIPLHPNKKAKRGFNQSEVIANGISEVLQIPVDSECIYRNTFTSSQTKKTRFERWQNVENIFSLSNTTKLDQLNLLIIDDVITTGSTMEACVNTLSQSSCASISIATIACAAI